MQLVKQGVGLYILYLYDVSVQTAPQYAVLCSVNLNLPQSAIH